MKKTKLPDFFGCMNRNVDEVINEAGPSNRRSSSDKWVIVKSITREDILSGELKLSYHDVYNHVFPYWSREACSDVAGGNRKCVTIRDRTDTRMMLCNTSTSNYLEGNRGAGTYSLGWSEMIGRWSPHAGEEVGLYWEPRKDGGRFNFKLLNR